MMNEGKRREKAHKHTLRWATDGGVSTVIFTLMHSRTIYDLWKVIKTTYIYYSTETKYFYLHFFLPFLMQMIKMMLAVVGVFIFCWLPFNVLMVNIIADEFLWFFLQLFLKICSSHVNLLPITFDSCGLQCTYTLLHNLNSLNWL